MSIENMSEDGAKALWRKVFSRFKAITGDVDVKGKGTLQAQIDGINGSKSFKKVNCAVRRFTLAEWHTHVVPGLEGKGWSIGNGYDNSHLNTGDTAYIVGEATDVFDATGAMIQLMAVGIVESVATNMVTMTMQSLIVGGAGSKGDDANDDIIFNMMASYAAVNLIGNSSPRWRKLGKIGTYNGTAAATYDISVSSGNLCTHLLFIDTDTGISTIADVSIITTSFTTIATIQRSDTYSATREYIYGKKDSSTTYNYSFYLSSARSHSVVVYALGK